jgi:hypothetical protein
MEIRIHFIDKRPYGSADYFPDLNNASFTNPTHRDNGVNIHANFPLHRQMTSYTNCTAKSFFELKRAFRGGNAHQALRCNVGRKP